MVSASNAAPTSAVLSSPSIRTAGLFDPVQAAHQSLAYPKPARHCTHDNEHAARKHEPVGKLQRRQLHNGGGCEKLGYHCLPNDYLK
jgi:hypothetical protein